MYYRRVFFPIVAFALTAMLAPPALGLRDGPIAGWNDSLASAGNCTSCHGSQVGNGSVDVLGAPTTYTFDQLYDLRVRIEDPDQLGAGFQLSVEDAAGDHVGMLIITDAVNTQNAPGDPGWVTHTATGVDNSVAGWAAAGNAAEYNVGWRAPSADVGQITFYVAGNAINNDNQAFNGLDRIYLTQRAATAGDTCSDGEQNNGEQGIDCGGPCPACECLVNGDCDDGDLCTDDTCAANACSHERITNCCEVNGQCNDDNPCTADFCENFACVFEPVPGCCVFDAACDDANECTVDTCMNNSCVNEAIPDCCLTDEDCDDGVFCNGAETCEANECQPGGEPCPDSLCDEVLGSCANCLADEDCNDNNPCTDDVCMDGACMFEPNELDCDDGDPCTNSDQCFDGVCVGVMQLECCLSDDECDDGDECTEDMCVDNACIYEPVADCPADDGEDNGNDNAGDDQPDDNGNDNGAMELPDDGDEIEPPNGTDEPMDGDGDQSPPAEDPPAGRRTPRPATCGVFGIITLPALIFGLWGMRSRRRSDTADGRLRRT